MFREVNLVIGLWNKREYIFKDFIKLYISKKGIYKK